VSKRLVVVRHAKSSWDDPSLADHDRPLAPRGQKALPRLRDHLSGIAPPPDLVLCSTSLRTRQTLDGVLPVLGEDVPIELDGALYGAGADRMLTRLRGVDDRVSCVLLIGHNPGVEDLVELLVDSEPGPPDAFPTAAVAVLSFDGAWQSLTPVSASLLSLWTPRQGEVTGA
jgi:phosphohistidine phosphatase